MTAVRSPAMISWNCSNEEMTLTPTTVHRNHIELRARQNSHMWREHSEEQVFFVSFQTRCEGGDRAGIWTGDFVSVCETDTDFYMICLLKIGF